MILVAFVVGLEQDISRWGRFEGETGSVDCSNHSDVVEAWGEYDGGGVRDI